MLLYYICRAVYAVLGHISDAEELSDVITKTDDYLWLKVRKLLNETHKCPKARPTTMSDDFE